MKLPDQLLLWLYRVIQPEYTNPVLCYQDISLILMCYSMLKVRTSVYTNQSGQSQLQIKVYGTFPSEAINMVIWFPISYPQIPPVIYISHTDSNKHLSPNNYIDPSGRFYHPFLSNWSHNFANDTTNENIKPRDNRCLKLIKIVIQCIKEHPPGVKENSQTVPSAHPLPPPPSKTNNDPTCPTTRRIQLFDEPTSPKLKQIPPLLPANPNNLQLLQSIQKTLNSTIKLQLFDQIPLKEIIQTQNHLLQTTESDLNSQNYLNYIEGKILQDTQLVRGKITEISHLNGKLDHDLKSILPHFDQCLIAETPVYTQLYQLSTSIDAISDLLYYLNKLHDKGKIRFDRYLKLVRQSAREQCLLKQHLEKLVDICSLDKARGIW
ncbi:hypothetical protein FOA43_001926 [Brettanomyces nanus]|uniref:UEV domain-containing protein n=1 Tax=Eeniella nana TaxID=13502 RepID=A0A875S2M5_EENNA|nr:uncharacterized protein FOA43_001926 [Brettanomyces nanus]QPG74595.1 hypothetical protein FOA43_001926 [Brettanomyces nanus]